MPFLPPRESSAIQCETYFTRSPHWKKIILPPFLRQMSGGNVIEDVLIAHDQRAFGDWLPFIDDCMANARISAGFSRENGLPLVALRSLAVQGSIRTCKWEPLSCDGQRNE